MTTTAAHGAVVVAVDPTTRSEAALAWAARYASARRRPLLLVHATGVPRAYESLTGSERSRKELRVLGRRTLDGALAQVRAMQPELVVRTHLGIGSPHEVVLDSLDGAHLLVVGSRGRGTLASLVLGSTSVGMAAEAPCPVCVVRLPTPRDGLGSFVGRVVVGVDGTELSLPALDHAFDHASAHGLDLVVLHAWGTGHERDPASYELHKFASQEHHLMMSESLAGFAEKYPDVAVTEYHAHGEPAHELVRASEGAHTLVVGSRGRGEVASVVFGSVSRTVVEQARCPVLVVRNSVSDEALPAKGAS